MRKVVVANLLVLSLTTALATAAYEPAFSRYVPNEIIVKFRQRSDNAVRSSDKLNVRFKARQIKPVFKDFWQKQQKPSVFEGTDRTLLSQKQKHILARLRRAGSRAEVPDLGKIYKIQFDSRGGYSLGDIIDAYRSDPDVEYAELNYIVSADFVPTDPFYSAQWSLEKIDAPYAWDICPAGVETIVAVVDTGVDYRHRDLKDNMWINEAELNGVEGVDDDDNGYLDDIYGYNFVYHSNDPVDDHGHGTHCAGIIAAVTENENDIAGIARNTKVMAVKFLNSEGEGSIDEAVLALYYAVENGADVISNSWGSSQKSYLLEDVLNYAHSRGVIVVAAVGNDNSRFRQYPAGYESVLSVAATNSNDTKWYFSNYGNWVDIAAPGVDILSLRANGTSKGQVYSEYTTFLTGTSMAAPHVAGACAFLLSANPLLKPDRLSEILLTTADPIKSGICVSNGRLNLFNAIRAVIPSSGYVTLGSDYITLGGSINILVADWDLRGKGTQDVTLTTKNGDSETLVLSETTSTPGIFTGSIVADIGQPQPEDGIIEAQHDEAVVVSYYDSDNGTGSAAIATNSTVADFQPPSVSDVKIEVSGQVAIVDIVTSEPTTALIRCGPACDDQGEALSTWLETSLDGPKTDSIGPYIIVQKDIVLSTRHSFKLQLPQPGTDYYFLVELVDVAGNQATADNNGLCYSFRSSD